MENDESKFVYQTTYNFINNSNSAPLCQICMNHYDDKDNSPVVIQCGHTFCKCCVKKIVSDNNIQDIKTSKCPVCKKDINSKELVPNFELLSLIIVHKKKLDNFCENHINESLNFFCDTCKKLICQICLLMNHIGHELKRPEDSDLSKSLELFSSFNSTIKEVKDKRINSELEVNNFLNMVDTKYDQICNNLHEIITLMKLEKTLYHESLAKSNIDLDNLSVYIRKEYDSIIKKNIKTKINEDVHQKFESIKKEYQDISSKFSGLTCSINNNDFKDEKNIFNDILTNIESVKNILIKNCPEVENFRNTMMNCSFKTILNPVEFLFDQKVCNIKYDVSKSSKEHIKLIELASLRTECESEFIINVMKSIDRGDFVLNSSIHTYSDTPLMIGWNTTISAPHMHLLTISYLSKILNESFFVDYREENYENISENIFTETNISSNTSYSSKNYRINNTYFTNLNPNLVGGNNNMGISLDNENFQSQTPKNKIPKCNSISFVKEKDSKNSKLQCFNFKKPFLKALDIGVGSGYMTLALSKILGPNSRVIGIDHLEEIIVFASNNIKKNHKEFLDSGQIQLFTMDGKLGYSGQKFNIIHVGAAVQEIPQVFIDQLENEGYMWIPVGPKNAFKKIYLVYKDHKGEISKTELLSCSYAEMTTKEEQLLHSEDVIDNGDFSIDESF